MAKRPVEPCLPCLGKQQELLNAVAEGRVYDATKAAVIGSLMMAGLWPKKVLTHEEFKQQKDHYNANQTNARS